jgi:Ca2+-binding RTX toxin-like protein
VLEEGARSYRALEVAYGTGGDKLIVDAFFENEDPNRGYNPLQKIQFADGTVWTIADIQAMVLAGTAAGDSIGGTAWSETIDGGEGNDTLSGGAGNDTLRGAAGDDVLYGEQGNDTLDGGTGNDYFSLGNGNNTVLLGLGDGVDTLAYTDYDTSKTNTLLFKAGITPADVRLTRVLEEGAR